MQEFQLVPSGFFKDSSPFLCGGIPSVGLGRVQHLEFCYFLVGREDFLEVFREAGRSRLMAEVHRNCLKLGSYVKFQLFRPLSLAQIPVCARFLPRKIPDRAGGLLMVSLEGAVQPTVLLIVSPALLGHWEPKWGKPLAGTHRAGRVPPFLM